MKKIIFYFIFFNLIVACGGEKNPEPLSNIFLEKLPQAEYNWADNNKQSFFIEPFDNNSRGWITTNTGSSFANVSNGYYNFQSKTADNLITSINIPILDTRKNFQIETSIKIVAGNGGGIFWGFNDFDREGFYFYFNNQKNINLGVLANSSQINWIPATDIAADINTSSFNLLTIRKVSNFYYFFVNKKYIKTKEFASFYGNTIPIYVRGNSTIQVDYLNIHYLN